ncbi:probable cyclic nucleotide-gated ion channel 20, chloroplastic isoform X2 [Macadamia integrifolia]|uniref:probable cyclic nucleotide-gated ion channel 20, chloroplastic isoform X2 n=1 Tax=Macadamia integrifolia TaxID=60698 RepID=UPI001C4FF86B|nr:probable cyclic nucleotide-gated ion channel 20, chloroplastic isoform X2 [Macadamia integrifolia]
MDGGKKGERLIRDANAQSVDIEFQRLKGMKRSASMPEQMNSMESYESEKNLVSRTGPLQSNRRTSSIQMSGPLFIRRSPGNFSQPLQGIAGQKSPSLMEDQLPPSKGMEEQGWSNNDFNRNNGHLLHSRDSVLFDAKFPEVLYGEVCVRKSFNFLHRFIPGVMSPHAKLVRQWSYFVHIACFVSIFLDPLFFFLLTVQEDNKCIVLNSPLTTTLVVFRTVTDFIYFMHMLIQFRLAYVAPESRVVGAGDFVIHPKKVALNYLCGYFSIDLFVVLPLPQIMILVVLRKYVGSSAANYGRNLLQAAFLLQYMPRLYRFLPLIAGLFPTGFTFASAWGNLVLNLIMFILAGHVVGSCWYLFGLQRVNKCLQDACIDSQQKACIEFIDCGHGEKIAKFKSKPEWLSWVNNENATACFDTSSNGSFSYGIYYQAVSLSTKPSIIVRYVYSLFWGFLQISTLAGNQVPSYFVWEVLFTMAITGLGIMLFAILIGNIQNFLQSLGKRRIDNHLRICDVEQWMSAWHLPLHIRRKVRASERWKWSVTQDINGEKLMEDLPDDLQKEIRRHHFKFIKKVRIFSLIEDPILDSIRERLRQNIYIRGSRILNLGEPIEKMVFIVKGEMESIGEDCSRVPLSEGDICGEELLTWWLQRYSVNKGRNLFIKQVGEE